MDILNTFVLPLGQIPGDPYAVRDCYGPYLKTSFPDLDYALFGYNVLRGYPLANGHDPGFTLPIFAADYSELRHSADCRFSLPQGVTLAPDVSCVTSFKSRTIQNSYEFSESLSVSAEVSGGGWGVKFSASAGYKESSSTMASGESLYIISEARCNYYFSKLDPVKPPPFHPSFLQMARNLEDLVNEENYFDFFSYYGTHFPTFVTFGARYTHQHKMRVNSYKSEKQKGVNVAAQASYSGLVSVGGGFNMDSSQRAAASAFQKNVETTTITVGAPPPANGDAMTWAATVKDTPVPMAYKLESIEELFTDKYMAGYNISHHNIYQKIKNSGLKLNYCNYLRDRGETDSCHDLIPYIKIEGKEILGSYGNSPYGVSKSTCMNMCLQNDLCIEAEFTEGYDICEMNHHSTSSTSHTIFSNPKATLMIFTTKLMLSGRNFKISDAKVIVDIPIRSSNNSNTIMECETKCQQDPICAVYTFCNSDVAQKDSTKTCKLYSERSLEYNRTPITEEDATGYTTVFVARNPNDIPTMTPETTTTATTNLTTATSNPT